MGGRARRTSLNAPLHHRTPLAPTITGRCASCKKDIQPANSLHPPPAPGRLSTTAPHSMFCTTTYSYNKSAHATPTTLNFVRMSIRLQTRLRCVARWYITTLSLLLKTSPTISPPGSKESTCFSVKLELFLGISGRICPRWHGLSKEVDMFLGRGRSAPAPSGPASTHE